MNLCIRLWVCKSLNIWRDKIRYGIRRFIGKITRNISKSTRQRRCKREGHRCSDARGKTGSARGRCQLQGRKAICCYYQGEGDGCRCAQEFDSRAASAQDCEGRARGHDGWSEQQAHIFAKWIYCLYDGWSPGYW